MLPTSLRRATRAATFASAAALAACDIPSDPPIFQQTWIVPSDSITVGAAELLPAGMTVTTTATPTFVITTPAAAIATTLGEICGQPACQTPVTVVAPTPAFATPAGMLESSISMPTGVTSVTVTGGTLNVAITNNLGFDPLRPNGAATAPYGEMTVSIGNGALVQDYVFTGTPTNGLANGQTRVFSLPLPTGTYTSIALELSFDVPAGAPASMNGSNGLGLSATIQDLAVSNATIEVVGQPVNTDPTEFDLEDVDFGDDVQSGALLITTSNPFTATAALNVAIEAPAQSGAGAVSITKQLAIPAQPTSTSTIQLTGSEMRSVLGKQGVTIRVTGSVNGTGAGGTIIIAPASRITVRTQVQLTVNIGA